MPNEMEEHEARFVSPKAPVGQLSYASLHGPAPAPEPVEPWAAQFDGRSLPSVPARVAEPMRERRMAQYQMKDTLDEHGNPIPLYNQEPVIQGEGGRLATAWFRWEANLAGNWCPVVIYDKQRPAVPRHEEHRMSGAFPVPPEGLGADGSPMFGKLTALFPNPDEARRIAAEKGETTDA
jgi:hypothetical protein